MDAITSISGSSPGRAFQAVRGAPACGASPASTVFRRLCGLVQVRIAGGVARAQVGVEQRFLAQGWVQARDHRHDARHTLFLHGHADQLLGHFHGDLVVADEQELVPLLMLATSLA